MAVAVNADRYRTIFNEILLKKIEEKKNTADVLRHVFGDRIISRGVECSVSVYYTQKPGFVSKVSHQK